MLLTRVSRPSQLPKVSGSLLSMGKKWSLYVFPLCTDITIKCCRRLLGSGVQLAWNLLLCLSMYIPKSKKTHRNRGIYYNTGHLYGNSHKEVQLILIRQVRVHTIDEMPFFLQPAFISNSTSPACCCLAPAWNCNGIMKTITDEV